MNSLIITGNAEQDGRLFEHWFIGDIAAWCRQQELPFVPEQIGIRATKTLELKWGVHQQGDCRKEQWYSVPGRISLSILISGSFVIRFRKVNCPETLREALLRKPGDYAIWLENLEHTWEALTNSVVLTVRWHE